MPPAVREQCEDVFTFYEGGDDLILAYFIPGPDGGTDRGERRLNWVCTTRPSARSESGS